jgi:Tfp pilus assembly protein PilV
VHLHARDESGFGMLELLMAMVMLNVGILAIVAAFSSGNAALSRANRISTAGALANKQMEVYRGLKYDNIVFTTAEWTSAISDSTYIADTAYTQNMQNPVSPKALVATVTTCPANVPANACDPSYTTTGADHHSYRVDT